MQSKIIRQYEELINVGRTIASKNWRDFNRRIFYILLTSMYPHFWELDKVLEHCA